MEPSAVFVVFARVLVPILVVVGSGYALQRGIGLDVGPINRLTIYLLNPALIFTLLVRVRVESSETVRIVAFMVLFVLAIGAITWLSSRALGLVVMPDTEKALEGRPRHRSVIHICTTSG